jgi:purine-binding chemotaxis protein CheW
MDEREKLEELDPEKIIEEMREEYWRGLSEAEERRDDDAAQLLLALVGGERFAMEAKLCRTIIKAGKVTRVPRMPSYVLGVINLRGEIISVVDLAQVVRAEKESSRDQKSRLIVVESKGVRVSFLVDRILGIEFISGSRIQDPQSVVSVLKSEYVRGHIQPLMDEGWTTYLALEKIIHGQDLAFGK